MSPTKIPDSIEIMTPDGEYISVPPTDLESDEPPVETDFHRKQIELLIACLEWLWRDRQDFYVTGNLTIYYSEHKIKSRDFRGPDFFVVLGTDPHPRKSWTLWGEDGKYPNVIIEMLSDSTEQVDRTTKKALYQDTFRTPEYFWFHPVTQEFQGFELVAGQYEPIQPNAKGWLISQQLGLYLGVQDGKLRFFTLDEKLVPTPQESAEQAETRARQLTEKLRSLGINPDELQ